MGTWLDPAAWDNRFEFRPLPPDAAPVPVQRAAVLAGIEEYRERWPWVEIASGYGVFSNDGTTLVPPPDFPPPPAAPGDRESASPRALFLWERQRQRWYQEAERRGTMVRHLSRRVWLFAIEGVPASADPATQAVRVKAVDCELARPIALYEQRLAP